MRILALLALASSAHAAPTLQLSGPQVVVPGERVQFTVRARAAPAPGRSAEVHLLVGGPPDEDCVARRAGICLDQAVSWVHTATTDAVATLELDIPAGPLGVIHVQALGTSASGAHWSQPMAVEVAPGVCPTVGGDLACVPSFIDADEDGVGSSWTDCGCPMNAGWSPDGGDCDDGEPGVYPGQQQGVPTPDPVHGFDVDCDGVETVEHAAYILDPVVCTVPQRGWQLDQPPCGEEALWVTGARRMHGLCMVEGELRTVTCR